MNSHRTGRAAARGILLASLAAVFVAACGASASPSAPASGTGPASSLPLPSVPANPVPATVDSCAVFTDAEVQTATGATVVERRPSTLTQVFASACDVMLEGGGQLTFGILPSGGREMWEVSFEPTIGTAVLDAVVPDLGDAAASAGQGGLMVLAGDVLFDLHLQDSNADKQPRVRYLAEIVLARLPCLASGCPDTVAVPPPTFAAALDPCVLLTPADIEQTTSFPATVLPSQPAGSCAWTLTTGSDFDGAYTITLSVLAPGGRQRFDILQAQQEHVPSLGDDAVRMGGNDSGSILAVAGDRLLTLAYRLPLDTVDADPLVVPLVASAISRLPG